MKKLTALCLGLCLLLGLTACGPAATAKSPAPLSPEETVEEFIVQVQGLHYDHDALRFVYDFSPENQLDSRLQRALLGRMDYALGELTQAPALPEIGEHVHEEAPHVSIAVTVTAPDADAVLSDFTKQLNGYLKKNPGVNLLAVEAIGTLDDMLTGCMERCPDRSTQTLDVLLEQQDGRWVILFPDELLNALLGGLLAAYSAR